MFLMFGMILLMLIRIQNFEQAKEISFVRKTIQCFISLQRTILIYLATILIGCSLQLPLKSSSSIYQVGSILIIIPLFVVYGFTTFLSLTIANTIITDIPWASTDHQVSYMREAFKIIVTCQGLFVDQLRNSSVGLILYYAFLALACSIKAMQQVHYYNLQVQRVWLNCSRVTASLALILFVRVVLQLDMSEAVFYAPVIAYSSFKFFQWWEKRRNIQLLMKLKTPDMISQSKLQMILAKLQHLLQRQDREDLVNLQHVLFVHRLSCFDEHCVCNLHQRILINDFFDAGDQSNLTKGIRKTSLLFTNKDDDDLVNNGSLQGFDNLEVDPSQIEIVTEGPSQVFQDASHIQLMQTFSPYIGNTGQNFTFSFNTNMKVIGLSLEELFVENFKIETEKTDPKKQSTSQNQSDLTSFASRKEARKFVFYELISTIFSQLDSIKSINDISKTFDLHSVYAIFVNQNQDKKFLSVFELIKVSQKFKKLGFVQKIQYMVLEQTILGQTQTLNLQNDKGETLDCALFIEASQEQQKLDIQYEQATEEILEFWKKLKTEDFKIAQYLEQGVKLSKRIQKIKSVTKKLEEKNILKRDLSKYQLYALFHLEMLHDPITSSNMVQQIKNAHIYKNKSKWGSNQDGSQYLQEKMFADLGLCVVSAWEGQSQFCEFLYANKVFCQLFKIKESHIVGQNIKSIMPSIYSHNHDSFMKRFQQRGQPSLLGKSRALMAKDFQDFIFPIEATVQFYYHPRFGYSYIGTFEKIKNLNIYNDVTSKVQSEDCIFLITDENLTIQEYSMSFLTQLGVSKQRLKLIEDMTGKQISLHTIVQNIQAIMSNEFGQNLLPNNKDQNLANRIVSVSKYDQQNECFSDMFTFPALLTYVQHNPLIYKNVSIRANIFILVPLSKVTDFDLMMIANGPQLKGRVPTMTMTINQQSTGTPQNPFDDLNNQQNNTKAHQDGVPDIYDLSSMSSQTSSSTMSSSLNGHFAKNQLFLNKAPRILKISALLILLTVLAFFIIIIYNLASYLQLHSLISGRIQAFQEITYRDQNMRAALLDLKIMQSISQNITLYNNSTVLPNGTDRMTFYQNDLVNSMTKVKQNTDGFNQFINVNPAYSSFSFNFNNLSFVTEKGYLYMINQNLQEAIDLLTSKGQDINSTAMIIERPDLNVTNYCYNFSSLLNSSDNNQTQLSNLKQQLFFIFYNGLYTMYQISQRQLLILQEALLQQSTTSATTLSVTTFVSIGIMSLICILLIPLFFKMAFRYYAVIKFFIAMEQGLIAKCIEKALVYRQYLRQKLRDKAQVKDYQEDSEEEAKQGETQIINPLFKETKAKSKGGVSMEDIMRKTRLPSIKELQEKKQQKKEKGQKNKKHRRKNLGVIKEENDEEEESKQQQQKESSDEDDGEGDSEKKKSDTKKETQMEMQVRIRTQRVRDQIRKIEFSYKLRVIGIVILLMGYFNSAFIMSYSESQVVFQNDQSSFDYFDIYYQRQDCATNLMLFLREKIIQGYHIQMTYYDSVNQPEVVNAAGYYLNLCIQNQDDIRSVVSSIPQFLQSANGILQTYNSADACQYLDNGIGRGDDCVSAIGGLMASGLGNAMQYVIGYVQQINLNFNGALASQQYSTAFRDSLLNDPRMYDICDFIIYLLKPLINNQQDLIYSSAIAYFQSTRSTYLLVFGLFTAVTIFIVGIIGYVIYKKLKRRLLDIQNIIILMPLEDISHEMRQKIQAYINK